MKKIYINHNPYNFRDVILAMPTHYSEFLNESMQKKYYPGVSLSSQKIDDAQSQKQDFLLVGTDIYFVIKN